MANTEEWIEQAAMGHVKEKLIKAGKMTMDEHVEHVGNAKGKIDNIAILRVTGKTVREEYLDMSGGVCKVMHGTKLMSGTPDGMRTKEEMRVIKLKLIRAKKMRMHESVTQVSMNPRHNIIGLCITGVRERICYVDLARNDFKISNKPSE